MVCRGFLMKRAMKSLLAVLTVLVVSTVTSHAQGYGWSNRHTANDYLFGKIGAGSSYQHSYTPIQRTPIPTFHSSSYSSGRSSTSYFTTSRGDTYSSRTSGNTSYISGAGGYRATAKSYGNTTYVKGSTGFDGSLNSRRFSAVGKTYGDTTYITGSRGYSATAKTSGGTTYITNNRTREVRTV